MKLCKKGGTNDVSCITSWSCAKPTFPITLKSCPTFVLHRVSILVFVKLLKYTDSQERPFHNISNWRPVSVLANLSIVFENLISNNFQKICQTSIFLAKNQFDFRKKINIEVAALNLKDNLITTGAWRKKMWSVRFLIALLVSTYYPMSRLRFPFVCAYKSNKDAVHISIPQNIIALLAVGLFFSSYITWYNMNSHDITWHRMAVLAWSSVGSALLKL